MVYYWLGLKKTIKPMEGHMPQWSGSYKPPARYNQGGGIPLQYKGLARGIPESQLETWSHQGATVLSANTHNSVRTALENHAWGDVTYDPYLQGSYRNGTNIRATSDVDLVVELNSVFYNDLTDDEKKELKLTSASYSWSEFKNDVISALTAYYGSEYVDTSGSKSIKVLPDNNRLKADVVVCAEYRYYENLEVRAKGIVFWTSTNEKIINYPKLHYENGTSKNSTHRTDGNYKPTIRMFKNAREKVTEAKTELTGRFPSYFVECLLFNVPDEKFISSFRDTYFNVVNWLNGELESERAEKMVCQNRIYLFGPYSVQWNLTDAKLLVSELINLWNNW
jgi:hypothetical protein